MRVRAAHARLTGNLSTPGVPNFKTSNLATAGVANLQPQPLTTFGDLDLPGGELIYGRADGMTLDTAIEMLVRQNIDLEAARFEIPMAEADVLTANLRANPIFYADTQLIPYGHFSFLRPGGPEQSDVNINYPFDITHKRQARTASAKAASKVTEAQLQDTIRNQIDNLYTVYVGVIAAGLTEQFSEKYLTGITNLYKLNDELYKNEQIKQSDLLAIKANVERAQLQVRESKQAKFKANQALALILNLPMNDIEKLDVYDPVGTVRELPLPADALVSKGLEKRPDLIAIKLGVKRSEQDVRLAKANAYPDVYAALSALHLPEQHIPRRSQRLFLDAGRDGHNSALQPQPRKHHPSTTQRDADHAPGSEPGAERGQRRAQRGPRIRTEPAQRDRDEERDPPGLRRGPRRGLQPLARG